MSDRTDIEALGDFAQKGFTLEHDGDHIVYLMHQGESIARFSQTGASSRELPERGQPAPCDRTWLEWSVVRSYSEKVEGCRRAPAASRRRGPDANVNPGRPQTSIAHPPCQVPMEVSTCPRTRS